MTESRWRPTEDEEPVETLGADGTNELLCVSVRSGRAHGSGDDSDAFAAEHSSNDSVNLRSRSWIRNRIRSKTAVKLRLRVCWVTQASVGFIVQPATWTRRLASSMKNKT